MAKGTWNSRHNRNQDGYLEASRIRKENEHNRSGIFIEELPFEAEVEGRNIIIGENIHTEKSRVIFSQ